MCWFGKLKYALILLFLAIFTAVSANICYAYDVYAAKAYNQGVDLTKKGQYKEAVELFRKATAIDPDFIDAYFNLGSIYEYLGDNDKALEIFDILLVKNPKDYETVYKAATLANKKKDYKRAIKYLSQIPNDDPKYDEAQSLYKTVVKNQSEASENEFPSNTSSNDNVTAPVTPKPPPASKLILTGFQGPTGVASDKKGYLYVANYISNTIIQIAPDNKRTVFYKGSPVNGPVGLAVDTYQNVYVANYLSNEIIKITPAKKVSVILKAVKKPYYLYFDDNKGFLYISEQGTNTVIRVKVL
jgi:tetratricopeptide (TPR) repeat protein